MTDVPSGPSLVSTSPPTMEIKKKINAIISRKVLGRGTTVMIWSWSDLIDCPDFFSFRQIEENYEKLQDIIFV
jgi:hypothetical protein